MVLSSFLNKFVVKNKQKVFDSYLSNTFLKT